MKTSTFILAASVLASQAMALNGTVNGTLYTPIPDINANTTNLDHVTPSKNVTMLYGNNNTDDKSLVNVTLTMNYPSVILENIDALISVDCSDDAVTVTFNDTASYNVSLTEWFADGDFVMITNHEGDCDAKIERGFFLVKQLTWDNGTLSVTASTSRTNITETAGTAAISFGGIPANTISKRENSLDPSYTTSLDLALPANDVLYTLPGYLEVVADEVSFETNVSFSGYLEYSFWTFSIKELYFDLIVETNIDIAMTAEVLAAYSTTFTYAPDTLATTVVSVAGILDIGPAISFVAAAELSADTPVNVSVSTSIGLTDANVHLDLLDEDNTSATGWVPTYDVTAEVTGEVNATLNPSASVTVEIEIKFLGGLIDLSSGITAIPGFTNSFVLAADEVVEAKNGTVLFSSVNSTTGTCGDGLQVISDFTFGLVGFVTKYFSVDLYNTSIPVADDCLSWIG